MPSALRYDAFGDRTDASTPYDPSLFQFGADWGYQSLFSPGAEQGPGLLYLEQRYYDPWTGRFVSPDPLGYLAGPNLYGYADSDPVNEVDPEGLATLPATTGGRWSLGTTLLNGFNWVTGLPGRALNRIRKRFFSVRLQPGTPTLQNANPAAYPGLAGGGKEISRFLDRESEDIANQVFYGALALGGAGASSDWLDYHEAAGGHTLARHVALTDSELVARLAAYPNLQAASSFFSKDVAEAVVAETIRASRPTVGGWLRRAAVGDTLALDYTGSAPIGRIAVRNAAGVADATDARVVLRFLGGGRYYVLTAFVR